MNFLLASISFKVTKLSCAISLSQRYTTKGGWALIGRLAELHLTVAQTVVAAVSAQLSTRVQAASAWRVVVAAIVWMRAADESLARTRIQWRSLSIKVY